MNARFLTIMATLGLCFSVVSVTRPASMGTPPSDWPQWRGPQPQRGLAGALEPGKFADLALLDANPRADIQHTKRIHAVVVYGSYLPPEKLQPMRAAVASAARGK